MRPYGQADTKLGSALAPGGQHYAVWPSEWLAGGCQAAPSWVRSLFSYHGVFLEYFIKSSFEKNKQGGKRGEVSWGNKFGTWGMPALSLKLLCIPQEMKAGV